ncbi:zinc finger CCCH-type with G patch domain-containing protein [Anopheles ziemanni]|uniref:zinc finger CCCH-type with G patch domain-containing protein n=1 Tax=Anopheles coustani TaxID=139045 RepID=UPI0026584D38|nr:zinc finger CCCH-type with G patch domain-containing protein [Anopheles coustani]XP_058169271.1 zinc finger CCCH-type with G patch domain-containing protein [Anopheles ziemanni]
MSSADELNESIQQYTAQITQIDHALQLTTDKNERLELEKLKHDLTELLNLTRETLDHANVDGAKRSETKDTPDQNGGDDIEDEFAQFMKEIKQLDKEESGGKEEPSSDDSPPATQDDLDLDGLVGSKCSAPHVHSWGSKVYHNAMVCSLDTGELANATATVLFTNPTHQEMIPCSYFLEGECRFSEDRCRYSHGEVVRLDELRDYREPQFERLRQKGSRALVKQQSSRLWCRGTVQSANFEAKTCKVQLEEGKQREQQEVPFEDLFPLDDQGDRSDVDKSSEEDDSSDEELDEEAIRKAQLVEKSLFQPAPDRRLGEWEEYTRGIGSKIMQKMGYVVGTGLGKEGEGRVVPVSAQVLPQGRSLDYCMELREQANGDKDLFSVEKKLIQLRKQQERKDARDYARRSAAASGRKDVFSFINEQVFNGGESSSSRQSQPQGKSSLGGDLKQHSSKNLNIASLKLSEEIRRAEAEVERLKIALTRHKAGTPASDNLLKQIEAKRAEISRLQATDYNISVEQRLRNDKRKMTVF